MTALLTNYRADGAVLRAFLASPVFARALIGPRKGGRKVAAVASIVRRMRLLPIAAEGPSQAQARWRVAVIAAHAEDLQSGPMRAVAEAFGADTGHWDMGARVFAVDWRQADGRRWLEMRFFGADRPEQRRRFEAWPATLVWLAGARDLPAELCDTAVELAGAYGEGAGAPGLIVTSRMPEAAHWIAERFAPLVVDRDAGAWRLFRQPGGREAAAENLAHLKPGFYARLAERLPLRDVAGEIDAEWRELSGFDDRAPIDPARLALAALWHLKGGFPPKQETRA